jgi:pimeloyl-[acyl-carrier protein] methyl ester esterase
MGRDAAVDRLGAVARPGARRAKRPYVFRMNAGNGLPIVLLPGLNGTARLLEDIRRRLEKTRPALAIGYPTDQQLGYAGLVEFVRERLPSGRFVVLGESFSGPIAIELAARLPERVAGLVLRFPRPRWAMAEVLMGKSATPELKRALGETLATVANEVVAFRVGEAMRIDRLASLREVACPVLDLKGKQDWLLGDAPMREVMRTARRCEVREIDGPHMLLATHAAEAADALEAFCATLS